MCYAPILGSAPMRARPIMAHTPYTQVRIRHKYKKKNAYSALHGDYFLARYNFSYSVVVAAAYSPPCEQSSLRGWYCPPSLREPLGSWQSLALYVILSVTKDLLAILYAINAGCRLSASRRFFTSFRMTLYSVIARAFRLVAISRSLCHPECNEGSPRWLCAVNAGCRLSASRRFFTSFRMTAQGIITNY